ncbi:MAG: hypothetical protein AB7L17_16095 [Ilumatobacteraceae bacterium]
MMRVVRRLVFAAMVVGAIVLVVRRRRDPLPTGSGSPPASGGWPPIVADDDEPAATPVGVRSDRTWVEPVDGACPDGFPIKANANSGIFHVPGGRSYERTIPERCYATAQAAEADGYRAAKA